jgi:hypothetical protein
MPQSNQISRKDICPIISGDWGNICGVKGERNIIIKTFFLQYAKVKNLWQELESGGF